MKTIWLSPFIDTDTYLERDTFFEALKYVNEGKYRLASELLLNHTTQNATSIKWIDLSTVIDNLVNGYGQSISPGKKQGSQSTSGLVVVSLFLAWLGDFGRIDTLGDTYIKKPLEPARLTGADIDSLYKALGFLYSLGELKLAYNLGPAKQIRHKAKIFHSLIHGIGLAAESDIFEDIARTWLINKRQRTTERSIKRTAKAFKAIYYRMPKKISVQDFASLVRSVSLSAVKTPPVTIEPLPAWDMADFLSQAVAKTAENLDEITVTV